MDAAIDGREEEETPKTSRRIIGERQENERPEKRRERRGSVVTVSYRRREKGKRGRDVCLHLKFQQEKEIDFRAKRKAVVKVRQERKTIGEHREMLMRAKKNISS